MSRTPQDPVLDFLSHFTHSEILQSITEQQDTALLSEVLKKYAYQRIYSLDEDGRYFMLALLDLVDWSQLAHRVLAKASKL